VVCSAVVTPPSPPPLILTAALYRHRSVSKHRPGISAFPLKCASFKCSLPFAPWFI